MSDMGGNPKTEYSPGLEGVLAGESALCQVDEGESGLRYRGYAIADLAEQASFEEVAYLLLLGRLPTRKELDDFSLQLRTQWVLPGPVEAFIGVVPPDAHPMDILRTGVSLLGMTDPDAADSQSKAAFYSGIAFGVAGAALIAVLQELPKERRRQSDSEDA